MDDLCRLCGQIVEEDADDIVDHETLGLVHGHCLDQWRQDAIWEAADYYADAQRGT
jgi:hypothetical protein